MPIKEESVKHWQADISLCHGTTYFEGTWIDYALAA